MKKRKCVGCGKRLFHEKKYKPILVCRGCYEEVNNIMGYTLITSIPDYYEITNEDIKKYKALRQNS